MENFIFSAVLDLNFISECRSTASIPFVRPDTVKSLTDIYCSKTEISKISVWNIFSHNTSDQRGRWFDVTESVRGKFPIKRNVTVSFQ